jgi:hypothetical protein
MFWEIFFAILAALCVWSIREYWGVIIGGAFWIGLGLAVLGGVVWAGFAIYAHAPKLFGQLIGIGFIMLVLWGFVMQIGEWINKKSEPEAPAPVEPGKDIP